jgi:hypothetical protein
MHLTLEKLVVGDDVTAVQRKAHQDSLPRKHFEATKVAKRQIMVLVTEKPMSHQTGRRTRISFTDQV